jgi:putative photosynthetic complex assembly protein
MSGAHTHQPVISNAALVTAGLLVAFTVLLTASVQLGFIDREAVPAVERQKAEVAVVESRQLLFADRSDGAVVITDADTGGTIALIQTETESGGFVRGVMRGMARERHKVGLGPEQPFTLTLWQDGSLSLVDGATGRSIELGAFGLDNRAVFAGLLERGRN